MAVAFRIDEVRPEDLEEIISIETDSFVTPWHTDSLLSALERRRSIFIAAREGGQIIGYALSWLVADELHILKLAVHERYRRRGWGSRLLEETIQRAQQNGQAASGRSGRGLRFAHRPVRVGQGARTYCDCQPPTHTGQASVLLFLYAVHPVRMERGVGRRCFDRCRRRGMVAGSMV